MTTFDDLSDYDFELLVADLLSAEHGRRFETFPRGRDGGIDLRSRTRDGVHLVQCKHYPNAGIGRLLTAAREEKAKLADAKPKPRRYTFVTSRPLTRANKDKIVAELKPLVEDECDVLGGNDLESLLRKHPRVERSHVKLWLGRAAPLERIANAEVHARSEALLDEIKSGLPRYVQTASFGDARKLLVDHRVVIIAGPPGVGKTTLARLLMLDSAESGFVPYGVQADITEAWRLFKPDEPQVFFFDDFLGRTALFDTVADDARDLAGFIKRVRRSSSSRLILATREYVLRDAEVQVEEMKWQELESDKFSLTLNRYTRLERARIFYNHIYASPEVDRNARKSLLRERAYLSVIAHDGYSPRLIEWITGLGGHRLSETEKNDYAAFCLDVLDHPTRLWEHAFEQGLSRHAQVALYVLVTLSPAATLNDLQHGFDAAAASFGLPRGRHNLQRALKLLQDSFVTLGRAWFAEPGVALLNPSLDDFLRQRLADSTDDLVCLAGGCHFFEQVEWFAGFSETTPARDDPKLTSALAESALQTIRRAPRVSVTSRSSRAAAHGSTPLVARVERLAAWTKAGGAIARDLRPAIETLIPTLIKSLGSIQRFELRNYVRLEFRLRGLEIPTAPLKDALRSTAEARSDLYGYETLYELHEEDPELFSGDVWSDVRDRFADWALGRLHDPDAFDDMDELDRVESLIFDFDIEVDEHVVDDAREAVEIAEKEREAEAMRDIEPDFDDDEPRGSGSSFNDDTLEIDALFGSLID